MSELRVAIRTLLRQPGPTVLAVLALGAGIGLTATMFSILDGVVLRGLPFDQPDELLHIVRSNPAGGVARMKVTIHDFADWRSQQRSFADLAAFVKGRA